MWKRAIILAAVLGIAACTMGPPVTRLDVAGGTVTVAAPAGYCIDRSATRDTRQGTFLLLGSCAAMTATGATDAVPVAPLVLTALVSDPLRTETAPDAASLSQYVRSDNGRASLSRSGQAQTVSIQQSETRNGVLYMKIRDRSPGGDAALSQDTWRAFLPMADRVVVLSAQSLIDQPVSSDAARSVLRTFVATVQAANKGNAAE